MDKQCYRLSAANIIQCHLQYMYCYFIQSVKWVWYYQIHFLNVDIFFFYSAPHPLNLLKLHPTFWPLAVGKEDTTGSNLGKNKDSLSHKKHPALYLNNFFWELGSSAFPGSYNEALWPRPCLDRHAGSCGWIFLRVLIGEELKKTNLAFTYKVHFNLSMLTVKFLNYIAWGCCSNTTEKP